VNLSLTHHTQDVWDSVDVERVRTACDPAASADLAVVLITVSNRQADVWHCLSIGSKSCVQAAPAERPLTWRLC